MTGLSVPRGAFTELATVDPRNRVIHLHYKPKKWFVWSTVGMLLFLCIAISVAGLILLRRGSKPRIALVAGSSMEPTLRGPRLKWKCKQCESPFQFCLDSLRSNMPLRCPHCGQVDMEFELESALLAPDALDDGELLEYMPPRFEAARRRTNQVKTDFKGFRRGDLLVIQDPDMPEIPTREVKRVVGFPNESISIRNGDLWINGSRERHSYSQILGRSLLVHPIADSKLSSKYRREDETADHWLIDGSIAIGKIQLLGAQADANNEDNPSPTNTFTIGKRLDFKTTRYPWISNECPRNAHDSHEVIMVNDIGCAIQITNAFNDWQTSITLRTPSRQTVFMLDCSRGQLSIAIDGVESAADFSIQESSHWIIAMIADGQAIAGTSDREIISTSLASSHDSDQAADQEQSPITVECRFGSMIIEQGLVFRDLHYRGAADSPSQTIEAGNGIVVLGDNVSLSNDSRQRWENDLSLDSVKGIVLKQREGLEALLWQR